MVAQASGDVCGDAAAVPRLLASLLTATTAPVAVAGDSIADWWRAFQSERHRWAEPIDQAVMGGGLGDRVACAFAAGYQAALRRMFPSLRDDRIASLCITEEGGGHPKALQATLRPAPEAEGIFLLNGRKKWATLSPEGSVLFVAAVTGTDDSGRNAIRLVQIDSTMSGVAVQPMPPTPFAPEIGHGQIHFADVRVTSGQVLPGDGYDGYIKPFRTLEDTHVNAALLGYLFRVAAESNWPTAVKEELLCLIVALRGIGTSDPRAAATHLALAGFNTLQRRVLDASEAHWQSVAPDVRARWERDAPLRSIAGNVRAQRRETAWKQAGQ